MKGEAIESCLARLLEARRDVRFAILFGSAVARGPEAARDLDVGVSFTRSLPLMELGEVESELEQAVGRAVDLVDLEEASTLLRWEALLRGRVLVAPDREALLAFQARVPIEHFDLLPYLEREAEGLRESLRQARWSASTW